MSSKQGSTNFLKTCFNGVNTLSGIGLIAIPYTLSKVGWLGLSLLLIMAIIFCYTGLLIQRCMDFNPSISTYSDIGFNAFGHRGRVIVSTFSYLELYLISTSFLVLEGDNLHTLFPDVEFKFGGHHTSGGQLFTTIAALIVLPSMWFENLSWLSYISAGGVLSYILIIGCVLWTGAVEGVGFSAQGKLFDFTGIPAALSLYAFCFGAHSVFPTIYSSMREKNKFLLVLLIMFGVSTLSYMSMGAMGYLMFGEKLLPEVTLNLPAKKISSQIATYTILVGPLAKYALTMTPLAEAIENELPHRFRNRSSFIITRTLLLISTTIVAVAFPYLDILMALEGAVLVVIVSIVIPCLCYLKISNAFKTWSFEMVIIVSIILLGIVVGVLGTYSSMRGVIKHH